MTDAQVSMKLFSRKLEHTTAMNVPTEECLQDLLPLRMIFRKLPTVALPILTIQAAARRSRRVLEV